MPAKKKTYPEAEALFKGPEVPSLAEQARSDREADAQAVQDKTASLRSQRLAKETMAQDAASDRPTPAGRKRKD